MQPTSVANPFPFAVERNEIRHEVTDTEPVVYKVSEQALTPFIQTADQIDKLEAINGVSIEQIEKRARPVKGWSQSGFLGENESFKEVLKKDWATVEKMGMTHAQLAAHLKFIIDLARKAPEGPYEDHDILYKPSDMTGNSVSSNEAQELKVYIANTRGYQFDLFAPPKGVERDAKTPHQWSEEFTIKHIATGTKVTLTVATLCYIELFGFYEGGGKENRFRADPEDIMTVLTGKKP